MNGGIIFVLFYLAVVCGLTLWWTNEDEIKAWWHRVRDEKNKDKE